VFCDIENVLSDYDVRNLPCWMAYMNLGNILYKAGRIPEAMDRLASSRIKPAVAHYSLGNALIDKAELLKQ